MRLVALLVLALAACSSDPDATADAGVDAALPTDGAFADTEVNQVLRAYSRCSTDEGGAVLDLNTSAQAAQWSPPSGWMQALTAYRSADAALSTAFGMSSMGPRVQAEHVIPAGDAAHAAFCRLVALAASAPPTMRTPQRACPGADPYWWRTAYP